MNREQKAVAIEEIAAHIDGSHAIFAVDYRGISVPQVAELRAKLRDADATFKVVKNSLTERAADQAGAESLKDYLAGPTALTFVRGDVATAAKAVADYARATQLLPFKGGLMDGATLDVDQLRSLSRLPSRDVLYGQLVGVVASPVGGLVRSLSALVGGLASALGQVREKKESGELPAGEPPAGEAAPAAATAEAPAAEEAPAAVEADAPPTQAPAEQSAADEPAPEEPAAEAATETEAAPEEAPAEEPAAEAAVETTAQGQAEPASEPAQDDDKQADASAEAEQDPADAKSTKED
ncbi:MAG TPA: 50S ribosomal protein L10 [Solirubrobacteraceae bacterium]|jgi:large subunit ribosomal protein L10|nr:50S ribosomal protein L10 [Solirubrobacteraceae bacterium]